MWANMIVLLGRRLQWMFCLKTWCNRHCFETNWTTTSSRHLDDTIREALRHVLFFFHCFFIYLFFICLSTWLPQASKVWHWVESFSLWNSRMVMWFRNRQTGGWNLNFGRTIPLKRDSQFSKVRAVLKVYYSTTRSLLLERRSLLVFRTTRHDWSVSLKDREGV